MPWPRKKMLWASAASADLQHSEIRHNGNAVFFRVIVAVVARVSFFVVGIIRCCWLPRCLHRFRRLLPFVGRPLLPSLYLLAVVFACVCLLLLAAACQRLVFTVCGRRGSGAMACSGSGMGQGCLETSRMLTCAGPLFEHVVGFSETWVGFGRFGSDLRDFAGNGKI